MHPDVAGAVANLEALLERILELLEWEKLTQPPHLRILPPSFRVADHIDEDLRALSGSFCVLAGSIKDALNAPENPIPDEQRMALWSRLAHAEARLRDLRLGDRFIRA